jgi:pimeloyl-ACP methyl ester carboxylesterase
LRRIVALAVGIGAITAALATTGLLIARRLTAPPGERVYDLTIRGIVRDGEALAVVLDRNSKTEARGIYNLWLEGGGWVKLGAVVGEGSATVTRTVARTTAHAELSVGQRASWSGIYYRDPQDACLDAVDIDIATPAGPAPTWIIRPATSGNDVWAIHIHGLGSSRAGTLRGVEVASELDLTSLVVTYRNDGEGPTVGTGRSTLGALEKDDVREVMHYAIDRGARRMVLFGWSMGAAIALQLAAEDEFQGLIDAVVLDSPVLDWSAAINANCARVGLPSWFGFLAGPWLRNRVLSELAGLEAPIPLDRFDWVERSADLSVPTLILQGTGDSSAPFAVSSRVAELRPDLVRYELFRADHTMTWNSDPERWQCTVREWLACRTRS